MSSADKFGSDACREGTECAPARRRASITSGEVKEGKWGIRVNGSQYLKGGQDLKGCIKNVLYARAMAKC